MVSRDHSKLTREGLKRAVRSGKKLGSPKPQKGAAAAAAVRTAAALNRAEILLPKAGKGSLRERAARLNAAGYRTAQGKLFNAGTLSRMLKRTKPPDG